MLELFRSPRRAFVWCVEASLLLLLALFAAGLSQGRPGALGFAGVERALMVAVIAQGSMYYHGLYAGRPMRPAALASALARALFLAAAMLWVLSRLLPGAAWGGRLYAAFAGALVVLPAWRAAFQRVAESPLCVHNVLLLGGGPLARACAALLGEGSGLALAGVLVEDGEPPPPGARVLGCYADVARACEAHRVTRVVVASRERLPVEALLDLKLRGVEIEDGLDFHERAGGRVFVSALRPSDLVFCSYPLRRTSLALKRAFDVAAASLGLVLASPLLVLAAIAIKLDSPGPVLYAQERAGLFGRPFRVRKLRSMRTDAEVSGARWALEHDPRVTRVGRFLRRSRLDEVPQLWNVLCGEMSLVGPRPERPVFIAALERQIPFFRQRLCMKPGVTGHAQVRCRYGASVEDAEEKLAYDLFYIKRFSLWFDLSIVIDTVKVVLLGIGSR